MSHREINQDSGVTEYYTPEEIVELAREVLGKIDLDPASSLIANETVKADKIFTIEDDGLAHKWSGNVFMNHPFSKGEKACIAKGPRGVKRCKKKKCQKKSKKNPTGRGHCITKDIPSNLDWITNLDKEFKAGNVKSAISVCFSSMSEAWMEPLLEQLQCFPRGRVNYRKPDGTIAKGVTKGTLITYYGPNPDKFREVFEPLGRVK